MARKPKPSGRDPRGRDSRGRKLPDKGKTLGQRPVQTQELRPRFLIVCEGEQTEPNYFRSFRVNAEVEVKGTGQNTLSLLEYTRRLQAQATLQDRTYTAIWTVFDKDDYPADKFNQAIEQARQAGFEAAYSNQAFELWYILHFEYVDSAIDRLRYQEILSQKMEKPYNKNDFALYGFLLSRQALALRYAEKLFNSYQPTHNPANDNPCTTVFRLIKALNQHLR